MNQPMLRPSPTSTEIRTTEPGEGEAARDSAYPKRKRVVRPGWKATIVRDETFKRLRAIQKSTTDPVIDLSYLTDACLQMALESDPEEIVKRALAGFRPMRTTL